MRELALSDDLNSGLEGGLGLYLLACLPTRPFWYAVRKWLFCLWGEKVVEGGLWCWLKGCKKRRISWSLEMRKR